MATSYSPCSGAARVSAPLRRRCLPVRVCTEVDLVEVDAADALATDLPTWRRLCASWLACDSDRAEAEPFRNLLISLGGPAAQLVTQAEDSGDIWSASIAVPSARAWARDQQARFRDALDPLMD